MGIIRKFTKKTKIIYQQVIKFFHSRKSFILIVVLFLLILAIPTGVTLVQRQQQLRSKALDFTCPIVNEYDQCGGTCYDYRDGQTKTFEDNETVHIWQHDVSDPQCQIEFECESRGVLPGQCGNSDENVPISPPATTTNTPAPTGGTCNISAFQTPSIGDQCVTCIVTYNPGVIDSIKGLCKNPSATNTQLINFWCNGGMGTAASADCQDKKEHPACGKSCNINLGTVTLCGVAKNWVDVDLELWNLGYSRNDLTGYDHGAKESLAYTQASCPGRLSPTPTTRLNTPTPTTRPGVPTPTLPLGITPPVSLPCTPGDLDGDGCVGSDDFTFWLSLFSRRGYDQKADIYPICKSDGRLGISRDNKIDLLDFNAWFMEFLKPGNPNVCR